MPGVSPALPVLIHPTVLHGKHAIEAISQSRKLRVREDIYPRGQNEG